MLFLLVLVADFVGRKQDFLIHLFILKPLASFCGFQ